MFILLKLKMKGNFGILSVNNNFVCCSVHPNPKWKMWFLCRSMFRSPLVPRYFKYTISKKSLNKPFWKRVIDAIIGK